MTKKEIIQFLKRNHLMEKAYLIDMLLFIVHKETPEIDDSLFTYINTWKNGEIKSQFETEEFIINLVNNNYNYAIQKIKEYRKDILHTYPKWD